MELLQKTAKAFLFGGAASVLTQLLFTVLEPLPFTPYAKSLLALLAMGVLGACLFFFDIYPRLEQRFGFGAMLPICGLPAAVAGGILSHLNNGEATASALKKGILPVAAILLTGFIFSVCAALILSLF